MNAKTTLLHGAGKAVKKAAPTILTVVSAAGVVATAALAVRATPKALKRIEAAKAVKKAENGGNLTRMETIGGWMVSDGLYWVDFDHQKTVVDDGLNGEVECYIIDAPFPPVSEREYEDMEL